MLALTRSESESIIIETSDGIIEVTVVRFLSGQRVRIGVEAPLKVPVNRREIWEEIQWDGKRRGNDSHG